MLDCDAAGNGWFVDPTPWEHGEFGGTGWAGNATGRVASERIDLLTTLAHEFGQLLRMNDLRQVNHVMNHELQVGRRFLPDVSDHRTQVLDVNGDLRVSSMDALLVINQVSRKDLLKADARFWHGHQDLNWLTFDTNLDGYLSTIDVLGILNEMSLGQDSAGEPELFDEGVSGVRMHTDPSLVDSVHAEITRVGLGRATGGQGELLLEAEVSEFARTCPRTHAKAWNYRNGIDVGKSLAALGKSPLCSSEVNSLTNVDLTMTGGLSADEIIQARLA